MEKQNYTATIEVKATAEKAFRDINNVSGWWTENLEGKSEKLDDVFTVQFGPDSFVTHRLVEVDPNNKAVWLVTDCYLSWLKDKTEWTGTQMSFEISTENNPTVVHFTHIGLVPEVECYNDCVKGWDQYIKVSLLKLINDGKGEPQMKK